MAGQQRGWILTLDHPDQLALLDWGQPEIRFSRWKIEAAKKVISLTCMQSQSGIFARGFQAVSGSQPGQVIFSVLAQNSIGKGGTCLKRELMLFPSMTRPGLFPPTGCENPATASPVLIVMMMMRRTMMMMRSMTSFFNLNGAFLALTWTRRQ